MEKISGRPSRSKDSSLEGTEAIRGRAGGGLHQGGAGGVGRDVWILAFLGKLSKEYFLAD